MNKLKSFVQLDIITTKPYLTVKYLLICALMIFFIVTVFRDITVGISVGMVLGIMCISYPFAVGEKSNMDVLYVTLSVNRKIVVLGRYIFTFLLYAFFVLFSLLVASSASLFVTQNANFVSGVGEVFGTVFLLTTLFSIISAVQLPIFFKFGYSRAKFISLIPFFAILIGYPAWTSVLKDSAFSSSINNFLISVFNGDIIIAFAVFALILVMLVSYRLSLSIYKRREF